MLTINPHPKAHFFVAALIIAFQVSFAQDHLSQDSASVLAMNKSIDHNSEDKDGETEDLIQPQKKKGKVKNSLTKREIFIDKGRTSYRFKYGGRIQTRFDLSKSSEAGSEAVDELYFRRVRFKSDGHLFSPKFGYKLEIDIIGTQVLDAYLRWNFYKNFEIWAGQTKLRGNRERVISSQNLQFVDRSLLNARFTLDRDMGFWLLHHFNAGQGLWRQVVSVSKGEGLAIWQENPSPIERGLDYTARLEYLPFGSFKDKGDYKGSDLEREPTPKLAVGLTFDYNNNAIKSRGQKGSVCEDEANIQSWIGDLMFKYRGFSVMSEYVDRKLHKKPEQSISTFNDLVNDLYTGTAFNIQSGYVFTNNYEIAGRYTQVRPEEASPNNELTQYTVALSKYIVGHNIKVQTDFSWLYEESKPMTHIYRLQFELSL